MPIRYNSTSICQIQLILVTQIRINFTKTGKSGIYLGTAETRLGTSHCPEPSNFSAKFQAQNRRWDGDKQSTKPLLTIRIQPPERNAFRHQPV
jgi:hypothetical protein